MTLRGEASSGIPAGEDLSAQENDLRALVEHVPLILALLDPDGTILYANTAALAIGEVSETNVIGRKLWDTGHWPDDRAERARLEELVHRVAGGSAVCDETPITPPSGRSLRIEFSLTPVLDADGHVTLIAVEARDVTTARTAELQLRLSRQKYQGIVSISADAVITIDEQQRILEYNDGAASIFGWSAAEAVGQPLDILIPEPLRAAHRQHVTRFGAGPVVARRMGERREISGLRKDGTTFPADASISKLDVDGQRIYNVVLRDITAIQRSASGQEFLARAGALLASSLDVETTHTSIAELIVEELADCAVIYEVESHDVVRRVSIAVADQSLRPVIEELRGRPFLSETRHPVLSVIETGESELLAEIGPWWTPEDADPDLRLFRELPIHSAMIVPLNARGQTTGAIGFYRAPSRPAYDADDLHIASELGRRAALALDSARLYRAATDAIRARDDVLSVVSHDLGNPISAIRIGVSLLLRNRSRQDQPGEGWEHLAGIKQSVEQMERLIRDLLEVKRIEAGHLTLNREYLTAGSLFEDMTGLMGGLARSHDMTLTTNVEPGLPLLRVDRERILQVLSNLVGNAIKFTPSGGAIKVEAKASGGEIVISVRDNGAGIESQHLDQIFDRFWQAHRNKREGIGLGLAIVRSIVEAHGGRVWAASELGKGTTISFTLTS